MVVIIRVSVSRTVNWDAAALYGEYKLTTIIWKPLACNNYANAVCLLYKLIADFKDSNDLSIGSVDFIKRRKLEVTDNEEALDNEDFTWDLL